MLFYNKNKKVKNITIRIGQSNINITLDKKLTWKEQITPLKNFVEVIQRGDVATAGRTRLLLSRIYVKNYLQQQIIIWGTYMEQMQRVQNNAIKFIFNLDKYTSSVQICAKLVILKLKNSKN